MAARRSKIRAAFSKSLSSFVPEVQKEKSEAGLKCEKNESARPEIDENTVNLTPNLKDEVCSDQISMSSTIKAEEIAQETIVYQNENIFDRPETSCQVEETIGVTQESAEVKHEKKTRPLLLRRKIKPKIPSSVFNKTSVSAEPTSPSTVEGNDKQVVTQEETYQNAELLDQTKIEGTATTHVENGSVFEENVDGVLPPSASQESIQKEHEKNSLLTFRRKIKPKIPNNVFKRTLVVAEPQEGVNDNFKDIEFNTSSAALLEKGRNDEDKCHEQTSEQKQDSLLEVQKEDQSSKESAIVELAAEVKPEVKPISKSNGPSFRRRVMKPNLVARSVKLETEMEISSEIGVPKNEIQMQPVSKNNIASSDIQAENEAIKLPPKTLAMPFRRRSMTPNIIRKNSKSDDEGPSESQSIPSRVPIKPNSKIVVLNNEILEFANYSKPGHDSEELRSDITITPVEQFGSSSYVSPASKLTSADESRKSDSEYSAPLSPTKLSRPRMRPNPLSVAQRYRHTSASESEEESRKSYRQRNDSVCSATSTTQDAASISDCFSPQKSKEYNSVIQRKCRRSEQSRKLAEAKHDFALKFGNSKPDRKKLKMIDLVFYNPTTNLMASASKKEGESAVIGNADDPIEAQQQEMGPEEQSKSGSDEENEMPAPQLKIGPDGQLMIDERSLKVESKSMKRNRQELERAKIIDDGLERKGLYKRAKRSKDWSKQETLKFYRALNTIGTDFTLMCDLFPRRTRRELKMKFKKEERMNANLIHRHIMEPCGFDFNLVKHEADLEEKELVEIEKQKQRELEQKKDASKKRKWNSSCSKQQNSNPAKVPKIEPHKLETERKKSKNLDIMDVLDDDEDDDNADVDGDSDSDTAEDSILQSMTKPTRSGRVPKIRDRYMAPPIRNQIVQTRTQERPPGSLTVMTTTGPAGQPVYKVFMNNSNGLENLFSISAEISSTANSEATQNGKPHIIDENVTIPADENVTIPADENVTIPADENITIPADENVTIPADENVAIPADENVTIPADENVTIPADENVTIPADENSTIHENVTVPAVENVTVPAVENVTVPADENVTVPADENITVPADKNVTIPAVKNVTVPAGGK